MGSWFAAALPGADDALGRALTSAGALALMTFAPTAVLMATAYVRIHVVLGLLRHALGNPSVPGAQVMTILSLLLTAAVMKPVADRVYADGLQPYTQGRLTATQAWEAGTAPVKSFMVKQIIATGHQHYLVDLYDRIHPPGPNRPDPEYLDQLPLRVVAPAFLLSELTTAFVMGFAIFLPFLVIDLVVSAVLATMGLFLLPPAQVALPLKLMVFVLAEGWWLVSDMLLRSFTI